MCFEWTHLIQIPSQEHPLILSRLRPPLFSERESQCTCLDGMAFKWPSKTSGEAMILSKNLTNSPLKSSLGPPNPKVYSCSCFLISHPHQRFHSMHTKTIMFVCMVCKDTIQLKILPALV